MTGVSESIWHVQGALDRAARVPVAVRPPRGASAAAFLVRGPSSAAGAFEQLWAALTGAAAPTTRLAKERKPTPDSGQASPYHQLIQEAAAREQVDPALVRAVVRAESNFNPRAESPAGAKGLMQLMDGTARSMGVTNPFDAAQNIAGGVRYLRQLLQRYKGDVTLALAAYNAGPGAVDRYGAVPPYAETQQYVRRVLQHRDQARTDPAGLSAKSAVARASG